MTHDTNLQTTRAPILTIGGTGKTGGRVTEKLRALGLPVRVGSRSAEIPFDWQDPSTWENALAGVRKVYATFFPDLSIPAAAQAIRALAGVAERCGVEHVVLLSGRGEEGALVAEEQLQRSGLDWTIVRASWFAQNWSEGFLADQIRAGHVVLPAGEVTEPFIDADDIADVAVAALTEEGHAGQVYEVTGPRLLTFPEAVEEIARASGRQIHYQQISPEAFEAGLAKHGVPFDMVSLLGYLFRDVLDGRNESLSDGVQRALGREPRDFQEYARDVAATGVWRQEAA